MPRSRVSISRRIPPYVVSTTADVIAEIGVANGSKLKPASVTRRRRRTRSATPYWIRPPRPIRGSSARLSPKRDRYRFPLTAARACARSVRARGRRKTRAARKFGALLILLSHQGDQRRLGARPPPCVPPPLSPLLGPWPFRRPTRRRIRRPGEPERALARNLPPHRRILSFDRRAGRIAAPVAHAADLAVAGLGAQRDAGSRGARPHLRAARQRRPAADPARPALLRRRAARSSATSAARSGRGSTARCAPPPRTAASRARSPRRRACFPTSPAARAWC